MKRLLVIIVICVLISVIGALAYTRAPSQHEQRYKITLLADIVNGVPRHLEWKNNRLFNKGWRLNMTLDQFLRRYPDAESDMVFKETDGTNVRLPFYDSDAFPELYKIWDAPLKARLLALWHGKSLYSRIPMVYENPLPDLCDIKCTAGNDTLPIWKEQDGSYPRSGCYMLYSTFIGFVELQRDGWSILNLQLDIYRLREGHHYTPNSYPQLSDWEPVLNVEKRKKLQVDKLPFGTYMLYNKGNMYPEINYPAEHILIISVMPCN